MNNENTLTDKIKAYIENDEENEPNDMLDLLVDAERSLRAKPALADREQIAEAIYAANVQYLAVLHEEPLERFCTWATVPDDARAQCFMQADAVLALKPALAPQAQPLTDETPSARDVALFLYQWANTRDAEPHDSAKALRTSWMRHAISHLAARDRMAQQAQRKASWFCSAHQFPNEGGRDYDPTCRVCWPQQAPNLSFEEWYPDSPYGQSLYRHEYQEPSRIAYEAALAQRAQPVNPNIDIGTQVYIEGGYWVIHTIAWNEDNAHHPKNIVGIVRCDHRWGIGRLMHRWISVDVAKEGMFQFLSRHLK